MLTFLEAQALEDNYTIMCIIIMTSAWHGPSIDFTKPIVRSITINLDNKSTFPVHPMEYAAFIKLLAYRAEGCVVMIPSN